MNYAGLDGFLGNCASLMLDVVFAAMFAVVPMLVWSVYLVRFRKKYALHKRIQVGLALVLLAAVTVFEVDVRLHGWRDRASASPYYDARFGYGLVNWSLWIHLLFAVTTFILWAYVVFQALRQSPVPPTRPSYARSHRYWATVAAVDMGLTAISGCAFYVLAFVVK